jgi:predicted  nucleic acid-binding Zn-ribbon protein
MTEKIFKGIKQVSAAKFNEAKELGLLAGYLWFVRTEVLVDGEEANTPDNDNYDIYFGSKQYGHFRAGELDAIRTQIESLNGNIAGINEVLAGLVEAAETAQAAIAQEVEDRKAADEEIRGNIEGLSNDIRSEVSGMEEALRNEIEAGNAAVREEFAASQEALRTAYEQADADTGARIAVIEGEDAGMSMRAVAIDELAKQLIPENAKESLDTLKEIAEWIQQHPEDVAQMNEAIAKNTGDIATLNATASDLDTAIKAVDAEVKALDSELETLSGAHSTLETKVGELEAEHETINSQIEAVNERVDNIPTITVVKVNGNEATIEGGVVDANVEAKDIQLGEDITGDAGATVFGATEKVTEVLKKINDSIRASSAGGVQMISSEDSSVNVNNDDTKYPKISLNVEAVTETTVADGHIELVKGENGLYGVMYYDGDDVE